MISPQHMNNVLIDMWCSHECENNRLKTSSKPRCDFVSSYAHDALFKSEYPKIELFSDYAHKAIAASILDLNWRDNAKIDLRGKDVPPRIAK